MNKFISIMKALADPNRVRALAALRDGELCVCQLIELLGLAPSTVSKHMSVLKQVGLVESRKEERWMYYQLPKEHDIYGMIQDILLYIFKALENDDTICRDRITLKNITKQSPAYLCKQQRNKVNGC